MHSPPLLSLHPSHGGGRRAAWHVLLVLFVAWIGVAQAYAGTKKHASAKAVKLPRQETAGVPYATRPDALEAAKAIAERRSLDPAWVADAIRQARFVASIAKAAQPPASGIAKNWTLYRSRFVEPVRIQAGIRFWTQHRAALERAERETGVPAAMVVGILGVETIYGQQTGSFRVIDALCTLAFDFPPTHPKASLRAAYFLTELEEFLALAARTNTNPLALRGSYAGALGLPQFMPSSWAKYAVDYDGDGRVDLFHSPADAIGSVANYLQTFQWKPGLATHFPVEFNPHTLDLAALLAPDIAPSFTPEQFAAKGAVVDAAGMQHPGLLALVELQNGPSPAQYVAGTENFYAITRYNWSSYYAMAVIELGQAVATAMPK